MLHGWGAPFFFGFSFQSRFQYQFQFPVSVSVPRLAEEGADEHDGEAKEEHENAQPIDPVHHAEIDVGLAILREEIRGVEVVQEFLQQHAAKY